MSKTNYDEWSEAARVNCERAVSQATNREERTLFDMAEAGQWAAQ